MGIDLSKLDLSKLSVDRIEDSKFAVCELPNNMTLSIPVSLIPFEIKEGDILNCSFDGLEFKILGKDEKEKERRLSEVNALLAKIRARQKRWISLNNEILENNFSKIFSWEEKKVKKKKDVSFDTPFWLQKATLP